jgi:hypothetical protein
VIRSKYRTRRERVHSPQESSPMPIFTRSYVALAVTQARAIDKRNDTDTAIQRVADLTHLTPEAVAEIARDEAHTEALTVEAERAKVKPCRGCGACGKAPAVAELAD